LDGFWSLGVVEAWWFWSGVELVGGWIIVEKLR